MKKLTPMQRAWSKEISRIKSAIRRLEARGYQVDYTIPERPDRITKKTIANLRSETTAPKMLSRSTYVTKDGEIISGYQASTEARKRSGRKGALTRKQRQHEKRYKEYEQRKQLERWKEKSEPQYSTNVLENLRRQLASWSRGQQSALSAVRNPHWKKTIQFKMEFSTTLLNLLDSKIAEEGERRVALRLETNASIVNEALERFIEDSDQDKVKDASVQIATIINGKSLTKEESEQLAKDAETYILPE